MRTLWNDDSGDHSVTSPVSLIVSAFASVRDVRQCVTPQIRLDAGDSVLLLVDLGAGRNRLGGSALAQVFGQIGTSCPDVQSASWLDATFEAVRSPVASVSILTCTHLRVNRSRSCSTKSWVSCCRFAATTPPT